MNWTVRHLALSGLVLAIGWTLGPGALAAEGEGGRKPDRPREVERSRADAPPGEADVMKRLNDMERRIDRLVQEMENLRRAMRAERAGDGFPAGQPPLAERDGRLPRGPRPPRPAWAPFGPPWAPGLGPWSRPGRAWAGPGDHPRGDRGTGDAEDAARQRDRDQDRPPMDRRVGEKPRPDRPRDAAPDRPRDDGRRAAGAERRTEDGLPRPEAARERSGEERSPAEPPRDRERGGRAEEKPGDAPPPPERERREESRPERPAAGGEGPPRA